MGAGISLMMRRLIARALVGMALALMLRDAAAAADPVGMVLAPIAFLSLLANRRWFMERMPNIW